MSEFNLLKKLVLEGVELTYGKMTLCNLENYVNFRRERKWQVYCTDKRAAEGFKDGFYFVYKDLEQAIFKFIEIKSKISSKVR